MALDVHRTHDVISKVRKRWRSLKALPAGKRFQTVHQQQADAPAWVKPVVIAGALVSFAIAILLSVLPGPAFVFYGLAGALAAVESAWLARALDRGEVAARKRIKRFRRWRSKRRAGAKRRASTRGRMASGHPQRGRATHHEPGAKRPSASA